MLKDIFQFKVEDLVVVIMLLENGDENDLWDVVIFNLYEYLIFSVLVMVCGYGEFDGEQCKMIIL